MITISKFITVEGPDFCGKSTQINLLIFNKAFSDHTFFTREPGSLLPESIEICEDIRRQILENEHDLLTEATLFAESRYYHTEEIVSLYKKYNDTVIISDRYFISSLAYQAYAQGLGMKEVYNLNKPSLDLLKENNIDIHCIKFDIDQHEWQRRRYNRLLSEKADSIEQKDIYKEILEFFSNDDIFNLYIKDIPNIKTYTIDASKDSTFVYFDFLKTINEIINS